jgi:hypothetical protein
MINLMRSMISKFGGFDVHESTRKMASILENKKPGRLEENISIDEFCREFGKILGINGSVSRRVLYAALENGDYANNLLLCRKTPGFMNSLLANPPMVSDGGWINDDRAITRVERTLLNWSKTGFSIVDEDTLKQREDACLSCPNLIDPKNQNKMTISPKAYINKLGERTGDRICKICGCNAGGKMRRTSASCPDKHPTEAGMTRWQEPLESPVKTK